MEVIARKQEFHRRIECSCGAVLDISLGDLRCVKRTAPDMLDWFPIFVVCPECGEDVEQDVPKHLRQPLVTDAQAKGMAPESPSIFTRILRWCVRGMR